MQKMKGSHFLKLKGESEKKDITSHGHAPFIEPRSKNGDDKYNIDKSKESRKRVRTISTSSESDVEAGRLKSVEIKEPKSLLKIESKVLNSKMREMKGTSTCDEQMKTEKLKDTNDNQIFLPIDDSRIDSNGSASPVQSEVSRVQKTAGIQHKQDNQDVRQNVQDAKEHSNLSDIISESSEVTELKKLNNILEEDLTAWKTKYRQLQEKYNKQTERIETLQFLNEKLQTQLYIPSREKGKLIITTLLKLERYFVIFVSIFSVIAYT